MMPLAASHGPSTSVCAATSASAQHEPQQVRHRELAPADFARMLEHRLYRDGLGLDELRRGCELAVTAGLAAVVCRPKHVGLAAQTVAGHRVDVVTALGWYTADEEPLRLPDVVTEAEALAEAGATELGIVAGKARLAGSRLSDQVSAVVESMDPVGVRVRVILDPRDLDNADIVRVSQSVARAGAWMVQGGCWRSRRASFSRVRVIRAAVPRTVLVKWTQPLTSVTTALLCFSMGVDRFNGDVVTLLRAAERAASTGGLAVPLDLDRRAAPAQLPRRGRTD